MELIRRADCGVMQSSTESAEGTLLLLERQNSATCSMVGGSCGSESSTCGVRSKESCASRFLASGSRDNESCSKEFFTRESRACESCGNESCTRESLTCGFRTRESPNHVPRGMDASRCALC